MKNKYLPFEEAREFVRKLKLKSEQEYHDWYDKNKPDFLPRHPDVYYDENPKDEEV